VLVVRSGVQNFAIPLLQLSAYVAPNILPTFLTT